MSGQLWSTFREGNRSEYLAQYLMSAVGLCAPVIRQEDIGVDFYCAVAQQAGIALTFRSPFSLQVKSSDQAIEYGGADKKGEWKRHEIEWLRRQELPLLIGIVSKTDREIRIYSTQMLAHVFNQMPFPGQLVLDPDQSKDSQHDVPHAHRRDKPSLPDGHGDQHVWDVPLGPPVAIASIDTIEDPAQLAKIRESLIRAVHLDAMNLKYRGLGCRYNQWWYDIAANDMGSVRTTAFNYAWTASPHANVDGMIGGALPFVTGIANHLKAQGRTAEVRGLRGFFDLVDHTTIPGPVRANLPEIFGP